MSRLQRHAFPLLAVAGLLVVAYARCVHVPDQQDNPRLRAAQAYAEKLAAAATLHRQVTGDWPAIEDVPAAAIRAANASLPEEYTGYSSGGDCDEDGKCQPFHSVGAFRLDYRGFVWPHQKERNARTCEDVTEPRLTVKSYHGPRHYWNWQQSVWQREKYGESMPVDWRFAAVDDSTAWAVGDSLFAVTRDGGRTCTFGTVERSSSRRLADVAALTPRIAYVLSAPHWYGKPQGRVYKTMDGGATWQLVYERNGLVFMAFGFWTASHGIVLARNDVVRRGGNPARHVSQPLVILTTSDGGKSWQQATTPAVLRGESPKLRSLELIGSGHGWFATYAPDDSISRMFRTTDAGRTWSVTTTSSKPALGIDLIAFRDTLAGVALGCSYVENGVMRTRDGGRTWSVARREPCQECTELNYVHTRAGLTLIMRVDGRIMYSRNDGENWFAADSTLYRGLARAQPWRTWVEREGGWSTRWAGVLASAAQPREASGVLVK